MPLYVAGVSSGEDIRLGLTLHYDGSGFFGWQAQKDARTVQGEIETVAERLTGRKIRVLASGRTDRGVHATGQVVALDVPGRWTAEEFRRAANAVLPGWVRTSMAERSAEQEAKDRGIAKEEVWQERAKLYPPDRVVTPQEVAEMIAFLASEEASGISGEAIRVALGSVY